MTDIIIQGIGGRMGHVLCEMIAQREDGRVIAGIDVKDGEQNGIPVQFLLVDTLQKAKELPCVFNNWAVFYNGRFETVNLLDVSYLKRILKK